MVLWYKYQDLAISLFPAEVGLFADLDRPLILELLCILASHCGGFYCQTPSHFHHPSVFMCTDKQLVAK